MPNLSPVCHVGSMTVGMTTGEHGGHKTPHPACRLVGDVVAGQQKLQALGIPVGVTGDKISETDCCDTGTGKLGSVSRKLLVRGIPVQCINDATVPHNGWALVTSSNGKIQSM